MSKHNQQVKMDEINELEEYSLFTEFLDIASQMFFNGADDLEEYNISDEFDQELFDFEQVDDVVNDGQLIEVDEIDETETGIMQCIINMIELEYIFEHNFQEERRKTERRWGVHPINQLRRELGIFHNLFEEMLVHDYDKFFNYTRMTPERFQHLFELIETKSTKNAHNTIPLKRRLFLTLRFLSTGDSLQSLHYNLRVGIFTAHNIIGETCEVLWNALQPIYLKYPETEDWIRIEAGFREKLNLPNCVGALDGKLIEIFAPNRTGSLYFNYKKYFSTNLLALCDAFKNFTYVDVGSVGQQSDGGILFNSTFGKRLEMNKLDFPEPANLPHTNVLFPFFIIADSAFPLKENLFTPYAGDHLDLSDVEANFNNEQSSLRKIIENTFAILVRRWQVFNGPIEMHPTMVDKILKATIVLHNYIKSFDHPASMRYLREDRFTYPTTDSLRSFYESGLKLNTANVSEYPSVARDTYANYLMNVL